MRALKFFLPSLVALALAGCGGYRLGPVNGVEGGTKTVEVLPFNNKTLQPRLGDDFTQALRERFQADGTYRLTTGDPGDLVVSGVIFSYQREALGYLNADASTPQNFRVGATVHVIVRDRATGKVILDRDVKGHTLINVGSDLISSERQAGPMLAEDVAHNIVSLLAEGGW